MAKAVKEIKTFEERKLELIEKGKKEGFITFEELANSLKGLDIDSDALDELYNAFLENGANLKAFSLCLLIAPYLCYLSFQRF